MIPAHIASKVGFNNGFQTFGPAVQVSGGPYEIQSYTQGQDLVEVRNPHYWGVPGKLSKIVFRFITDDTQIPPAMQNGEVNLANPDRGLARLQSRGPRHPEHHHHRDPRAGVPAHGLQPGQPVPGAGQRQARHRLRHQPGGR